jgi:hypothetical protein
MDLLPRHAHVIANMAIGPALVGVQTHLSGGLVVSNIINKGGTKRGQAWPGIAVVAYLGIIRLARGFRFTRQELAFAIFSTLEQSGTD